MAVFAASREGAPAAIDSELEIMIPILLVEDNATNRDKLSRRVERREYGVTMDVAGREATRRTRTSGKWEPIIALTAHAMEGNERRAPDAGGDDHGAKPVDVPRALAGIGSPLIR